MAVRKDLGHVIDTTVVLVAWDRYADTYLAAAIDDIGRQYPRAGILVVDNASTTRIEIPGVRVVRCDERRTVGAARTFGLQSVETPYVLFWDVDDRMLPSTIGALRDVIQADQNIALVTTRILEEDGSFHHWPRLRLQWLARWPRVYAAAHSVSSMFPTTGATIMRTDFLRAGGGFPDTSCGDDWVAGVSMAWRGRVEILELAGRVYHHHDDSVSAAWGNRERLSGARSVRARLRSDPAVPPVVGAAATLFVPLHWAVLLVARPLRLLLRAARSSAPAAVLQMEPEA